MSVQALSTYSRENLEKLTMSLRSQLVEAKAAHEALTVRSREVLMDTGRCASLTGGLHDIQASLKQGLSYKALKIIESLMAEVE